MSSAKEYELGDVVRIKTTIKVAGVLTDPSTVTAKVRKPNGTLVTATATRESLGIFYYDVAVGVASTDVGAYHYRFEGTGPGAGAGEGAFVVKRSRVL